MYYIYIYTCIYTYRVMEVKVLDRKSGRSSLRPANQLVALGSHRFQLSGKHVVPWAAPGVRGDCPG